MSNFPFPWWDKTVTVYNKEVNPTTNRISWYRTVVENCFWKATNNIFNMGRYGVSTIGVLTETKTIICRIPQSDEYVNRREWHLLTDKSGHFTLENGSIIVLGEVDDVIDEYTKGQRSTDLLAKYKQYDECLEVDTYVDNVQEGISLPHYRIVGK